MELAGASINAAKSQWCQSQIEIVGYLCGPDGRRPPERKVLKIREWNACRDVSEVRSFLGLTGCFRAWVVHYATKARPLTELLKKGTPFTWGPDQDNALNTLKNEIADAIALGKPEYGTHQYYLRTDASGIGWGAELGLLINGKYRPIRFESGCWNDAERKYDSGKQECLAIVKSLRRLRLYLFGAEFRLETDARTLRDQLNDCSMNLLLSAPLTRWLAYIKLFAFEVHHVAGKKNVIADALSRKGRGPSDDADDAIEGDIKDYIDARINIAETD